ncbi:MAG: TRCF domain-containing protein, partial [Bacteroidota bacterium]
KEEISKQDDFVQDCTIDTDLEILIPDDYVESITERLSLYTRLDNCETDTDLELMKKELVDRFGPIPPQVNDLFVTVQCRWLAIHLGFEKLVLKNEILRCYFINRPDSPYFESATFQHILSFIQTETNKARLKQTGKMFLITVDPVKKMQELYFFLDKAYKYSLSKSKALA